MPQKILSRFLLGPIVARFIQPAGSTFCELQVVPASHEDRIVEPRDTVEGRVEIDNLPAYLKPLKAISPASLIHLKLREDDTGSGFASGVTMLESATMDALDYVGQDVETENGDTMITTTLRDRSGRFRCLHHLAHRRDEAILRSRVEFINDSETSLSLELLTSFALNSLTPFVADNATPHLDFHRFRTWWSMEGKVDTSSLEALHLERSWSGYGRFSERFGQVGTMPVRKWFPTAAVEDRTAGIVWAAQLAWAGSWQMELFRSGDRVNLAGGLADREFGHWVKTVKHGESFITPEAFLTAVAGSLDDACHALLDGQRAVVPSLPSSEQSLPICFNEWCTSWGSPNHENIIAIARRLQGTGVRYIVIDDGWAQRPADISMQSNGDWIVDETKFPGGLKPTCDTLREMGFIPGIWFEFEIANPAAAAWAQDKHFVQRDGRPLRVGSRRFWDLNDPWAIDYLTTKVIDQLRDSGIGYLKVDYNDNLGLGCDHPDSLGEGLRRHIDGVHAFFRRIRSELPDLVIENCSSGGHRLEPSMQALTSMGSFSDAHEAVIIPIIARNLHRMILPRQSLIWAVLHRTDSAARLYYSLSSTFLGRVCLSGDIHDLDNEQMDIVRSALDLYPRLAEIIDHGTSSFFGDESLSYADPVGWQAVVRVHRDQALVVVHGFDLPDSRTQELNLPWRAEILAAFHDEATSGAVNSDILLVHLPAGFHGGVWLMQRANSNSGSKTRNSTF